MRRPLALVCLVLAFGCRRPAPPPLPEIHSAGDPRLDREVIWDVVQVHPPGARWSPVPPEPAWWHVPVVEGIGESKRRLR